MTRIFITLLICGIIFGGCSSSSEKNEPVNSVPQSSDQVAVDTSSMQTPDSVATGSLAPVSMNPTQNNQPVNASATGMNPAHGEPGHRCDIAVGAPLNSPPGNPQNPGTPPSVMTMPQQGSMPSGQTNVGNSSPTTPVNVNPAGSQTTTAPGMNPPHGQPGHDCSVAVGAPLKK
jgi:hypothetical protein